MLKTKRKNDLAEQDAENKSSPKRKIVTIDTYDRISRRLKVTQVVAILLGAAMLIFLCLYVYQLGMEKRTYKMIYHDAAARSSTLLTEVLEDPFDYDTKYREITAELGIMCQMAYRFDAEDEQQKAVNELYSAFIKLPNQVKLHQEGIRDLLLVVKDEQEIKETPEKQEASDNVYKDLRALIEAFDKQDY